MLGSKENKGVSVFKKCFKCNLVFFELVKDSCMCWIYYVNVYKFLFGIHALVTSHVETASSTQQGLVSHDNTFPPTGGHYTVGGEM